MKLFFTVSEAARLLGVSISTVRRWADRGEIEAIRTVGGQRRIPREVIEEHLGHPVEQRSWPGDRTDRAKRKARNEPSSLRNERYKDRHLALQRSRETQAKAKEIQRRLQEAAIEFGYRCLDPVPYIFPNLQIEPEEPPLELKMQARVAVLRVLEMFNEPLDAKALASEIEKVVDKVRIEFFRPEWKRELITEALKLHFPTWIKQEVQEIILAEIRNILDKRITGFEHIEEACAIGNKFKDRAIRLLEERRGKEDAETSESFLQALREGLRSFE